MTSTTDIRNGSIHPEVLIALDTATHTGWAIKRLASVTSGAADFSIRTKATKTMHADHPGRRFAMFHSWLNDQVSDLLGARCVIAYEAVVGGSSAGGKVSLVQKGLEAILLMIASERGIPVVSFAPATIKKFATGDGTLSKESKAMVIEQVRQRFPEQEFLPHAWTKNEPWNWNDNQCDALALLDLSSSVLGQVKSLDPVELLDTSHELTKLRWNDQWKLRKQAKKLKAAGSAT